MEGLVRGDSLTGDANPPLEGHKAYGKWYNEACDDYDNIWQDDGGRWWWSARGMRAKVWRCSRCKEAIVIDCLCNHMLRMGADGSLIHTGWASKPQCRHITPTAGFLCDACFILN